MKKLLITTGILLALTSSAPMALAQGSENLAPPQMSQADIGEKADHAARRATHYERLQELNKSYKSPDPSLAPTSEDYAKARKARAEGKAPKPESSVTEIEAVRDQNNRIREYRVTPGSTHIPYTMENKADKRPSPSGNNDTLGTPKFIQFGF